MRSLSRILKPNEVALRATYTSVQENGASVDEFKEPLTNLNEKFDWEDAFSKREQLLREAREEARRIIAEANMQAADRLEQATASIETEKKQLEVLREEARSLGYAAGKEEGYAQGFDEGRQVATESVQEVVSQLKVAIEQSRQAHESLLEESRADLLKLAVAVAEKILCRELNTDQYFLAKVLDSILPSLDPKSVVSIRVCPATWKRWQDGGQAVGVDWTREFNISVVADETLVPGDLVIDTKWGFVDGRLQSRWQRILEGIDLVEACKGAHCPE